jgi:hypothetical protein
MSANRRSGVIFVSSLVGVYQKLLRRVATEARNTRILMALFGQIGLSNEPETLLTQDLTRQSLIINRDGDGGGPIGLQKQGIGEGDIHLNTQQIEAEFGERVPFREFNHKHFMLREGEPVVFEDPTGNMGVVGDEPDHRMIRGLMDGDGTDLALGGFVEVLDKVEHFADLIG